MEKSITKITSSTTSNVDETTPTFVKRMFANWEVLWDQMGTDFERQFSYEKIENTETSKLGLLIHLTNPKTNDKFSIIVSDEQLSYMEIYKRLSFASDDLQKVGKWLDERALVVRLQRNNIRDGKPIQINLLDGVLQNQQHPNTFEIPSITDKLKLNEGDFVKIVDVDNGERFWVEIEEFITEDLMIGRIDNELISGQPYTLNDKIFFEMKNVISIDYK